MIYNVAIIGYGYWGPKLARNFQNSNHFKVKYIIDNSKKNLFKAKIDFPLAKIYKNYNFLKKNSVDLVVIASPTKSHFIIAKYFLNKCHVLVEKPLSMSLREVKLLEKISKKIKNYYLLIIPFYFLDLSVI